MFKASHPQHTARQQTQPQKFTKLFCSAKSIDRHCKQSNSPWIHWCVCVCVAQSCPTLCDPVDGSPPGSSVREVLQARILGWVAMPSSRGSSRPRNWVQVSCTAGTFFTLWATRETHHHAGSKYLFVYTKFPFNFNRAEALLPALPNCWKTGCVYSFIGIDMNKKFF